MMRPKFRISMRSIGLWSCFIVLMGLSGFRWDVGVDFMNYYVQFGDDLMNEMLLERIEIGNHAVKYLLQLNGFTDGRYWIWVMALITLFCVFYSISKYSTNYVFSIVLYLCMGYFFYSLNGIRQHCAIAISMFSWQFMMENKPVLYTAVLLVASLFHTSVLIMLPFYLIRNHEFKKKMLIVLCCLCMPLAFVGSAILPYIISLFPKYAIYEDSSFAVASGKILSYLRMIFPLFLFYMTMQVYDKLITDRQNRVILNLSLCAMLWTILFPNVPLMVRIGYYMQLSYIFFIPILCRTLSKSNGKVFKIFTITYNLLFISLILFVRAEAKIIPYHIDFGIADNDLLILTATVLLSMVVFVKLLAVPRKKSLFRPTAHYAYPSTMRRAASNDTLTRSWPKPTK